MSVSLPAAPTFSTLILKLASENSVSDQDLPHVSAAPPATKISSDILKFSNLLTSP